MDNNRYPEDQPDYSDGQNRYADDQPGRPEDAIDQASGDNTNRRHYFRVNDRVALQLHPVADPSADFTPFFELSAQYQLISEFQLLDTDVQALLRGITESDRRLGGYLKILNRKLDSLCRTLALVNDPIDPAWLQDVSLSEGGLSFRSDTAYPVDSFLHMKLVLLPSYCGLLLTGRVLSCNTDAEGHQLHLEFVELNDSQRQLLARHILRKQQDERRQRF